jgi:ATP-dependent HslUV protease subunit HslV
MQVLKISIDQKGKRMNKEIHSTTVIAVRDNKGVTMIGDGQATMGDVVIKGNVRKVKRLNDGKILAGFAGSVADCFALIDKFEAKLEKVNGDMEKACIEMAKDWRQDKYMRMLQAQLLITDGEKIITMDGSGTVIKIEEDCFAIGSGGLFALSAAHGIIKTLRANEQTINATTVATTAMEIASDLCIYTNKNFVVERVEKK